MKISVIIPTYKPQAYLWECLDSLVAQTFSKEDFEIILVLNGCTEPWKSQIQEYIDSKMKGMNVKFIHTEQGGVSNARNIALDAAQGEYVTFIDDDDFVSEKFLEELFEKASPDTVALCYPYAFKDGHHENQLKYTVTDAYNYGIKHDVRCLTSRVRKYFSGPCMKLIPMSFIQGRRFDKRFRIGEDSLFMFLISDKIHKVALTSKCAVYYRRYRETSASFLERSAKELITNNMKLVWEYIKIYCHGGYSSYIFATRVASRIREMLLYPVTGIKKKV